MEEFVFHHDLVQKWATTLNARSILDLDWVDGAATFWNQLTRAVISGNSCKPGPWMNGPRGQNLKDGPPARGHL
ncbi:hypothetical protein [Arthrobacter sp. PsM3]|uniref:hypothetical protein n=1 Tax=Arthrobacter sp. PsM3 TaxID=3030531 RepID=UPI00263A4228|nr:hypothetical protein [Arthrobacter sp. PsM3]MDN4643929.1 hypothetical protein [Arthrobacter sp. PsM3]